MFKELVKYFYACDYPTEEDYQRAGEVIAAYEHNLPCSGKLLLEEKVEILWNQKQQNDIR